MREGRRTVDDSAAIGGIARNRLRRDVTKDANVDRDLIEKYAKAAANGRTVISRGGKDKASAGRNVQGFCRKAVAVKARSEIECTFALLKQARRFATRYEKTLRNYAAVVALGCALLWLRI